LWVRFPGESYSQVPLTLFSALSQARENDDPAVGEAIAGSAAPDGVDKEPANQHVESYQDKGQCVHLAADAGSQSLDMVKRYPSIAQADGQNAHRDASPVTNWCL
jgi:hypothetical protein